MLAEGRIQDDTEKTVRLDLKELENKKPPEEHPIWNLLSLWENVIDLAWYFADNHTSSRFLSYSKVFIDVLIPSLLYKQIPWSNHLIPVFYC